MTTELTTTNGSADIIERVVLAGDLSKLTPQDRVSYYQKTCQSLGLNPLTRPFEYITLNNKLTLYARRDATDQLRGIHKVSMQIVGREQVGDVYIVTARATMPDGRMDESTGVVTTAGLRGDALANALMKAETKAKRRVTLSVIGLGWLDESELETISERRSTMVDTTTGEILGTAPAAYQATNDATPSNTASDKQIGLIKGLSRKNNWGELEVLEWAEAVIGKAASFAALTKQQASDLITALKEAADQSQPSPAGSEPPPF